MDRTGRNGGEWAVKGGVPVRNIRNLIHGGCLARRGHDRRCVHRGVKSVDATWQNRMSQNQRANHSLQVDFAHVWRSRKVRTNELCAG